MKSQNIIFSSQNPACHIWLNMPHRPFKKPRNAWRPNTYQKLSYTIIDAIFELLSSSQTPWVPSTSGSVQESQSCGCLYPSITCIPKTSIFSPKSMVCKFQSIFTYRKPENAGHPNTYQKLSYTIIDAIFELSGSSYTSQIPRTSKSVQ